MASLVTLTLAAVSGSAAVMAYLVFYRNYNKANFLYLLYARTPFGRMFHASAIAKHRQALEGPSGRRPMSTVLTGGPSRLAAPHFNFETKNALVRIVPFLSDNYAYILFCKATRTAAVVDPADAQVVYEAIQDLGRDLGSSIDVKTILTTHYHQDHAGGNKELVDLLAQDGKTVEVVGGAHEKYPGVAGATRLVKHGDTVSVGSLTVRCLDVPCHTWGSVLFLCENICFSGDYLFSAGCGRFFEGGAKHFCDSLSKSVNGLADDVMLFPGHEYTVSNLKFAQKVLPDDKDVAERLASASKQREAGSPTIPSSLGDERKFNVFMRAGDHNLLDGILVERTKTLVKEAGALSVTGGADKHDRTTVNIVLGDKPDSIEIVRALRALKDRA